MRVRIPPWLHLHQDRRVFELFKLDEITIQLKEARKAYRTFNDPANTQSKTMIDQFLN